MAPWTEIRALFDRALELDEDEREAFLAREATDADVATEVRRLLAHARENDSFLSPPDPGALHGALRASADLRAGDTVGGYTIERRIGSGGMGVVYAARQERPVRTVALKMMSTRLGERAQRRFETEAEILGRLQHPGIAAIFELGVHRTDGGGDVAFFVMELVEGARDLVRYAREERLGVGERLVLVRQVCDALTHAHQRGVIHRDLKPGNVLVDASGRVKVIDYGVARVTRSDDATEAPEAAMETRAGDVFGTLPYISPEQLSSGQGEVDVRTDVYALGVVLYELLVGRVPFPVEGRSLTEFVHDVCDRTAEAPSSVVPTLARELDWITAKAMAKEPERRYDSAAELARDLERFERGEPVQAGPPTARYRLRKFASRHRLTVAAAAVALVSLVGGAVATGLALVEARERRDEAEAARFDAERAREAEAQEADAARVALRRQTAIAEAVQGMIRSVGPTEDGRSVTLEAVLERSRTTFEELEAEPEVRASLLWFLAQSYSDLGLFERCEEVVVQALAALEDVADPDRELRGNARALFARLAMMQQRHGEAEDLVALARADLQAAEGDQKKALLRLRRIEAILLDKRGRNAEAVEAYREVATAAEEVFGTHDHFTLFALSELGVVLSGLAQQQEAERCARTAYERSVEAHGEHHAYTLSVGRNLSVTLVAGPDVEAAVAFAEECVMALLEHYDERHRHYQQALVALSNAYLRANRLEEAEVVASDALRLALENQPDDAELDVVARIPLAVARIRRGRWAEAAVSLEEGRTRLVEAGLGEHPRMLLLAKNLAHCYERTGQEEEALVAYDEAIRVAAPRLPPYHPHLHGAFLSRAALLLRLDRLGEARAGLQEHGAALHALGALGASEHARARGCLAAVDSMLLRVEEADG